MRNIHYKIWAINNRGKLCVPKYIPTTSHYTLEEAEKCLDDTWGGDNGREVYTIVKEYHYYY